MDVFALTGKHAIVLFSARMRTNIGSYLCASIGGVFPSKARQSPIRPMARLADHAVVPDWAKVSKTIAD